MGIGTDIKASTLDPLFANTLLAGLTESVTVKQNKTPTTNTTTGVITWASQVEVTQNAIIKEYTVREISQADGKIQTRDLKMKIQKTTDLAAMSNHYTVDYDGKTYGVQGFKPIRLLDAGLEMWEVQLRER